MTRKRCLVAALLVAALSRPDHALAQDEEEGQPAAASPGSGTVGTTIGPQFPSVAKNTLFFGNVMVDYGQKDWPVEVVGGVAGASGSGSGYHIGTFLALAGGQVKREVGNGVAPYCGAGVLAGSVSIRVSGLGTKTSSVGGAWANAGVRFAVGDQVEIGPSVGFQFLQVNSGGKAQNAAGPYGGLDIAVRFGAYPHRAATPPDVDDLYGASQTDDTEEAPAPNFYAKPHNAAPTKTADGPSLLTTTGRRTVTLDEPIEITLKSGDVVRGVLTSAANGTATLTTTDGSKQTIAEGDIDAVYQGADSSEVPAATPAAKPAPSDTPPPVVPGSADIKIANGSRRVRIGEPIDLTVKDGSHVRGTLTSVTDTMVHVQTDDGDVPVPFDWITDVFQAMQ